MSQDIDTCENPPLEDAPNHHCSSEARDVCCNHSTSTSERTCFSKSNHACCEEGSNLLNSPKGVVAIKVHSIVIPQELFLMNEKLIYGLYFVHPMSFSYRNLTSVDNNRRWKMKVTVSPVLDVKIQAWNITKRQELAAEMMALILMEMYVFVLVTFMLQCLFSV